MSRGKGEKEGERLQRIEGGWKLRPASVIDSQRFNACTRRCRISCKEQKPMHAKKSARKGREIQ